MIPIDLVGLIRAELESSKRPPDGKLHASSDLVGSLRHSQLRFVGAPTTDEALVDGIRTKTGWFWHNELHRLLRDAGVPFMAEVDLTPWMPEGWSGTADWLFWAPDYEAFVLGDLKTTKGEAIKFREREGMSEEHFWQLSAYWYACVRMGLPMVKGFGIMYLPMNNTLKESSIAPTIIEADPIAEDRLEAQMDYRWEKVRSYATSVPPEDQWMGWSNKVVAENLITDELAEPLERVQKLFWDSKKKIWNLKLVPHWLTDFCPYALDLCDCSTQGETKIGHYSVEIGGNIPPELIYTPRKGYDDIGPEIQPDAREIKRRLK